jgi:phospholipid/cholesterol/gamma-HCH transport system ATP-binding protein
LLKCIVGLHEPTKGDVIFDGENFTEMSFEQRVPIRTHIGMLFQNSALFDSMTVEENIMFPLNLFTNRTHAEKLDRANFCLERVNLKGKNKLYPSELSGGMKIRVGIARAISMQPKYLFVDEPNSGLDPKTSILIDELINELTEEYQITTVIVTHDMNSVMGIGDHIIFLHQGKKWWEGTKDEIAHTDNKELNDFVFASKFMRAAKARL